MAVVFDCPLRDSSQLNAASATTWHVTQLLGWCYGWPRRIRSCWRALTQSSATTLVNSFIVATIDYCNSLLAGCGPQQIVPLVIYNCSQRDQVMPLLRDNLHWLCICEGISYQIVSDGVQYKAFSGLALSYITQLCIPVASVRPRSALRSVAHGILFVPQTRLDWAWQACVRRHRPCLLQQPGWQCSECTNTWRV